MTDTKYLKEVIKHLSKREDAPELINTLTIIANLMNEVGYGFKGARYERIFHHGDLLTIKVTHGKRDT